jgi:hypothetical protein
MERVRWIGEGVVVRPLGKEVPATHKYQFSPCPAQHHIEAGPFGEKPNAAG